MQQPGVVGVGQPLPGRPVPIAVPGADGGVPSDRDQPSVDTPAVTLDERPALLKELESVNWSIFRHSSFRENQLQIIGDAVAGVNDLLVVMPTGGGKSLCYQLPGIVKSLRAAREASATAPGDDGQSSHDFLTIVVSPLVSLVEDQIRALQALGLSAASLGALTKENRLEQARTMEAARARQLQFLYLTPEKIAGAKDVTDLLGVLGQQKSVALFVVDEAHCVLQWGHDFRQTYLQLGEVREQLLPGVPIMALTATATSDCRDDIVRVLGMKNVKVYPSGINRPNLFYEVIDKKGKMLEQIEQIANWIYTRGHCGECGIIYTTRTDDTATIADGLAKRGHSVDFYHAQLPDAAGPGDAAPGVKTRRQRQEDWSSGRTHIIVATSAFGMGIDRACVRFVIHHALPGSVEEYYQQSGRAGRDGQPSDVLLMFHDRDRQSVQWLIDNSEGSKDSPIKTRKEGLLDKMMAFGKNLRVCRRAVLLRYFDETAGQVACEGGCDVCAPRAPLRVDPLARMFERHNDADTKAIRKQFEAGRGVYGDWLWHSFPTVKPLSEQLWTIGSAGFYFARFDEVERYLANDRARILFVEFTERCLAWAPSVFVKFFECQTRRIHSSWTTFELVAPGRLPCLPAALERFFNGALCDMTNHMYETEKSGLVPRPVAKRAVGAGARPAGPPRHKFQCFADALANAVGGEATIRSELSAGQKTSCWMWWAFPQLVPPRSVCPNGLRVNAQMYALHNFTEVVEYLASPLGEKLVAFTQLCLGLTGRPTAESVFAHDDCKFRSCMTAFALVSHEEVESVFFRAIMTLCERQPCEWTIARYEADYRAVPEWWTRAFAPAVADPDGGGSAQGGPGGGSSGATGASGPPSDGPGEDGTDSRKPPGGDAVREPGTETQVTLIVGADVCSLPVEVDAIVNAANSRLTMGRGICAKIFAGAGYEQMACACRDLGFWCPVGCAKATPGFGLPVKYVIHAVGPDLRNPNEFRDRHPLLKYAYTSALNESAKLPEVRRVALCALCPGVYQYPLRESAKVAMTAVREWIRSYGGCCPLEHVYFTAFDRTEQVCYAELFAECFPGSEVIVVAGDFPVVRPSSDSAFYRRCLRNAGALTARQLVLEAKRWALRQCGVKEKVISRQLGERRRPSLIPESSRWYSILHWALVAFVTALECDTRVVTRRRVVTWLHGRCHVPAAVAERRSVDSWSWCRAFAMLAERRLVTVGPHGWRIVDAEVCAGAVVVHSPTPFAKARVVGGETLQPPEPDDGMSFVIRAPLPLLWSE
jgi:RecQ family ATP-dependent DNA helicase